MSDDERKFIQKFVAPARRARYVELASSNKRRQKLRNRLGGALLEDLDARFLYDEENLPPRIQASIEKLWAGLGANPKCHVLAEDTDLDGRDMVLSEIEAAWDQLNGILILIVPERLAHYRPERPGKNYILYRPS